MHERIDYGLAVVATMASGGGRIQMPPWYHDDDEFVQSEDSLMASLSRFATPKE